MAEYADWIEEEEQVQLNDIQLRGPRPSVDPALRRSVVLHEIPNNEPRKPSLVPASSTLEARNPGRRRPESRVFPGVSVQSREEKIKQGTREENYVQEARWPWALVGIILLLGGLALGVFGGWCIQQDFTTIGPEPLIGINFCGPAGRTVLSSLWFLTSFWVLMSLSLSFGYGLIMCFKSSNLDAASCLVFLHDVRLLRLESSWRGHHHGYLRVSRHRGLDLAADIASQA